MKQQTKTIIIVLVCLIILAGLFYTAIILLSQTNEENNENKTKSYSDNTAVRIIDGDTFELGNGDIVRLICVDAPEIGKAGADESAQFLSSLILFEELRLVNDTDDKDTYGRLLRYVYVNLQEENGREIFVNKEIVHQGYASLFIYGNDTSKCREIAS